jgi:hypothetical protein
LFTVCRNMTSKRPRLQGQWHKHSLKKIIAGSQYISGMSVRFTAAV